MIPSNWHDATLADRLEVGDRLRFNAELVDAAASLDDVTVLVQVTAIARQADGTVKLWLEHSDARPPVVQ